MAKASTCAWNDNPVTDVGVAIEECTVDGYALLGKRRREVRRGRTEECLVRTAHMREAASRLSRLLGTGVTFESHDFVY